MQCLDIARGETHRHCNGKKHLFLPESLMHLLFPTNPFGMLSEAESEDQRDEMLKKFERFQHLAELYHVYRSIQRYTVWTWYFVNPNLL